MSAAATKFSSVMNSRLLARLKKQADRNGQSLRFALEKAVTHYLDVVVPSAQNIRPEVLKYADETIAEYEDLMKRLAKAK